MIELLIFSYNNYAVRRTSPCLNTVVKPRYPAGSVWCSTVYLGNACLLKGFIRELCLTLAPDAFGCFLSSSMIIISLHALSQEWCLCVCDITTISWRRLKWVILCVTQLFCKVSPVDTSLPFCHLSALTQSYRIGLCVSQKEKQPIRAKIVIKS